MEAWTRVGDGPGVFAARRLRFGRVGRGRRCTPGGWLDVERILNRRQINAGNGGGAAMGMSTAARATGTEARSRGREIGRRLGGSFVLWRTPFPLSRAHQVFSADEFAASPAMTGAPVRSRRGQGRLAGMRGSGVERKGRKSGTTRGLGIRLRRLVR